MPSRRSCRRPASRARTLARASQLSRLKMCLRRLSLETSSPRSPHATKDKSVVPPRFADDTTSPTRTAAATLSCAASRLKRPRLLSRASAAARRSRRARQLARRRAKDAARREDLRAASARMRRPILAQVLQYAADTPPRTGATSPALPGPRGSAARAPRGGQPRPRRTHHASRHVGARAPPARRHSLRGPQGGASARGRQLAPAADI